MRFEKEIEKNFASMLESLRGCLRIPSVYEASDVYPYGESVNKALEYTLKEAEKLGFKTVNLDGQVGWAEYGEGEEMIAVLGHLDVVPADGEWHFDPYGAEIADGKLYGRGTMDDKGPIYAGLFGLKAVADAGVKLDRRVRVIFGTNEETGSKDMKYYKANGGEIPVMGFTPDGGYPLINGEKGLITEKYSKKLAQKGALKMTELWGGTATNIVPDKAYAVIECSAQLADQIAALKGEKVAVTKTENGVRVDAEGVNAHGSHPEQGENAIGRLLIFMKQLPLEGDLKDAVTFVADKVGMEPHGESLGIDLYDEVSGHLVNNLGVLRGGEDLFEIKMNYRYPVTFTFDDCGPKVKAQFEAAGFERTEASHKEKLYVPEDAELCQKLLRVYADCTGLPAVPESIGGGTYAKSIPNVLAFGPCFPDDEVREHKPDEFCTLDWLKKNMNILAEAIYELAVK